MGEIKRFKRTNQFGQIYEILCAQKCVSPLTSIRAHLTENRLKFCCDRVNREDWSPILNSLAADRSLVEIRACSRYRPKKINETIDTEEKLEEYSNRRCRRTTSRGPVIYTNFLLRCFVDAVAVCARNSSILTSLSLDGIPLDNSKYLEILCAGLVDNRTLENISLARCRIGDGGCDILLRAISDDSNIQYLDLTACSLTSNSGDYLASFLRNKRLKLLSNVWHRPTVAGLEGTGAKQSSRGLRILVLDKNRQFGDDGLRPLVRALMDDFWLKKLSLRSCGLARTGGDAIVDLLETNSVLNVMNLSNNNVQTRIVRSVRRLLKRREKNGERIPFARRLIKRKKYAKWKVEDSSMKKRARNERKIKRPSCGGTIAGSVNKKCLDATGPNLRHLSERLSTINDRNRRLMRALAIDRLLLVREKCTRLRAERSYRLLKPIVETLRCGIQKHNGTRYRSVLESRLCSDLRTIFRCLERISAANASRKIATKAKGKVANSAEEIRGDDLLRVDGKKRIFRGFKKRPYCSFRKEA